MKKFFKITGISLLLFLLILISLPFVFKGKIIELSKKELNKNLNAVVDFKRFGLNFFRDFPHASLSLGDFSVSGVNEFEGDTLFYARSFSAKVNLKSLFGDSGYEISRMNADRVLIRAIVLEDGKANWDITFPSEDTAAAPDTVSHFKLYLQKVTIRRANIYYDDGEANMNAVLKNVDMILSGDMTADETRLHTRFSADELSFVMDKIPYLSKATCDAEMNIQANLEEMKFSFAENTIQLNEIKANIDGWIALLDEGGMDMDLRLHTPTLEFKDILSMIPAIYAKDFKDLKTAGEVSLEASISGLLDDAGIPAFDVQLQVAKAMFQYPGMPQSVSNVGADIRAYNKGGAADNTIVDIKHFHFEMAGNPFDVKLHVSTPVSDPNLQLSAVGHLNLSRIKDVYPLEDLELNGSLDANLQVATRMSYLEKEQYDKVQASGTLHLQNMSVKSETGQDIGIQNAHLSFSPRYVDLSAFSAQIGKNDIAANGKLENFIPYLLKDETLKGNMTVSSNYLNLNDFMTDSPADTTAIGIIEIPKNLDLSIAGNFKQVIFDNLDMTDVSGRLFVKEGKVDMKNLSFHALGGSLQVDGSYDTGKNPKQPLVAFDLNMKEVSFAQTFSTFITIQQLAPIFESFLGNFSTTLKFNSALGADFMPLLSSLTAGGLLQSNDLEIKDAPILNGLASALQNESLRDLKVKDLKLPFSISDGKVTTKPFDLRFGGGSINLSGITGLDQTIDYAAKINLTEQFAKGYINNVNVKIGGTFAKPVFSIDAKGVADQLLGKLAESIPGVESTGTITEIVNEEFEKQSEIIRQQAKEVGDRLIAEAEKDCQKLMEEANKIANPIARTAAVKAAEIAAMKVREEARKEVDKLNAEADKQIEALKSRMNH